MVHNNRFILENPEYCSTGVFIAGSTGTVYTASSHNTHYPSCCNHTIGWISEAGLSRTSLLCSRRLRFLRGGISGRLFTKRYVSCPGVDLEKQNEFLVNRPIISNKARQGFNLHSPVFFCSLLSFPFFLCAFY